ncbi:hypothetical protein [Luteimonas deserti]|uniref:Uncharacterized protein n=1 Tax=Luteimonas deserti TaxID=2752306 RepID=A0A7Z0QN22_9GAMM|nr:hypothetical protein [Luteimonas deserti]NYZ61558.1 hypothetical protein [Luteimonas deserti]
MIMIAAAFLSLWHGKALKSAATVGEAWIKRINAESTSQAAVDDST